MLVGLACAVKLTPGVFIVYLLVTGRRRAAAVAAAAFVAASLLAAGVLPHDSKRFWTDALWHSERLRANGTTFALCNVPTDTQQTLKNLRPGSKDVVPIFETCARKASSSVSCKSMKACATVPRVGMP